MTGTEPRAARVRAGGRSEAIRQTVARTVLELLREGDAGFTVAGVAARAGLPRSTVYRWWPTRVELVREALTLHTAELRAPDTGAWPTDVEALTRELAAFFAQPVERAMNAVLAADVDSEIAAVQRTHWMPIAGELSTIVARGKERGEVRADADPGMVMQMITGPLLLGITFGGRCDEATVRGVTQAVTRAYAAG